MSPRRLLAGLALCLSLPAGAGAEESQSFRDWQALCREDGSGLCVMESEAVANSDAAARLRLTRPTRGPVSSLRIILGEAATGASGPVELRVDDRAPHRLDAPEAGRGELASEDGRLLKALLPELRAGRSLVVSFRDGSGAERSATFSLLGVTAALRHFDHAQQRPAPDLLPPPAGDSGEAGPDGEAVFTPAGEMPPLGGCYDHERKVDRDGRFLGWNSFDRC